MKINTTQKTRINFCFSFSAQFNTRYTFDFFNIPEKLFTANFCVKNVFPQPVLPTIKIFPKKFVSVLPYNRFEFKM